MLFTPLLLESNLLPGMFSLLLLHSQLNEALLLLLPSPHTPLNLDLVPLLSPQAPAYIYYSILCNE